MTSDLRPGPDSRPIDELQSAEATLRILQDVLIPMPRDALANQTPCSEFDVQQLTDHLLNSISVVGAAADAQLPGRDDTDAVERQVIAAARPALDAWHRHGLAGTVQLGGNAMPATVAVGVLSIEFLVHAWDYAVAIGREVKAPEPVVDYVLELARTVITPQGRSAVGFADPVDVPDDAGALDQLIAFTGRHPSR